MIIGEKELNEAFERLSSADIYSAAGKAIQTVQAAAKNLCPVRDEELRGSIYTELTGDAEHITASCYTNKEYAQYVEFGTGPKGQASHEGTSPDAAVAYSQSPWWIHESQVGRDAAEQYGWFHIDTPEGRFYQCSGQAAQPYMYPAIKDSSDDIDRIFREAIK